MPSKYSIRDLEHVSGIKAHTLRIWEQRYGILRPSRTTTNIRYYSDADMKRVLNISLLNSHGYKISKIALLEDEAIAAEAGKLLNSGAGESLQIERLVLCLMDMDETGFGQTVNKAIAHSGLANTVEKVLLPFLQHLGNLWQVGVVSAAQEHYISSLIRQKLIAGIDQLNPFQSAASRTYLLFLPEGELHELGLLYAHYLLKQKGHTSVYLGQSVPLEDLVSMCEKVRPHCLVSIFTSATPAADASAFLKACHAQMPGTACLVSGRQFFVPEEKPLLPSPGFTLFRDFTDFKKLI